MNRYKRVAARSSAMPQQPMNSDDGIYFVTNNVPTPKVPNIISRNVRRSTTTSNAPITTTTTTTLAPGTQIVNIPTTTSTTLSHKQFIGDQQQHIEDLLEQQQQQQQHEEIDPSELHLQLPLEQEQSDQEEMIQDGEQQNGLMYLLLEDGTLAQIDTSGVGTPWINSSNDVQLQYDDSQEQLDINQQLINEQELLNLQQQQQQVDNLSDTAIIDSLRSGEHHGEGGENMLTEDLTQEIGNSNILLQQQQQGESADDVEDEAERLVQQLLQQQSTAETQILTQQLSSSSQHQHQDEGQQQQILNPLENKDEGNIVQLSQETNDNCLDTMLRKENDEIAQVTGQEDEVRNVLLVQQHQKQELKYTPVKSEALVGNNIEEMSDVGGNTKQQNDCIADFISQQQQQDKSPVMHNLHEGEQQQSHISFEADKNLQLNQNILNVNEDHQQQQEHTDSEQATQILNQSLGLDETFDQLNTTTTDKDVDKDNSLANLIEENFQQQQKSDGNDHSQSVQSSAQHDDTVEKHDQGLLALQQEFSLKQEAHEQNVQQENLVLKNEEIQQQQQQQLDESMFLIPEQHQELIDQNSQQQEISHSADESLGQTEEESYFLLQINGQTVLLPMSSLSTQNTDGGTQTLSIATSNNLIGDDGGITIAGSDDMDNQWVSISNGNNLQLTTNTTINTTSNVNPADKINNRPKPKPYRFVLPTSAGISSDSTSLDTSLLQDSMSSASSFLISNQQQQQLLQPGRGQNIRYHHQEDLNEQPPAKRFKETTETTKKLEVPTKPMMIRKTPTISPLKSLPATGTIPSQVPKTTVPASPGKPKIGNNCIFRCGTCKKLFNTKASVIQHMIDDHQVDPKSTRTDFRKTDSTNASPRFQSFQCEKCGSQAQSIESLQKHICSRLQPQQKPSTMVSKVNENSASVPPFTHHSTTAPAQKYSSSKSTAVSFQNNSVLNKLKEQEREKKLLLLSPPSVSTESSLASSKPTKSCTPPAKTSQTPKQQQQKPRKLSTSSPIKSPSSSEVVVQTKDEEPKLNFPLNLKCSQCKITFRNLYYYLVHKLVHTRKDTNASEPWKCEICQKQFAAKKDLLPHFGTHEFIEPEIIKKPGNRGLQKSTSSTPISKTNNNNNKNEQEPKRPRGRPRLNKNIKTSSTEPQSRLKLPPKTKKRGRPKLNKEQASTYNNNNNNNSNASATTTKEVVKTVRKSITKANISTLNLKKMESDLKDSVSSGKVASPVKRRGRPPKNIQNVVETSDLESTVVKEENIKEENEDNKREKKSKSPENLVKEEAARETVKTENGSSVKDDSNKPPIAMDNDFKKEESTDKLEDSSAVDDDKKNKRGIQEGQVSNTKNTTESKEKSTTRKLRTNQSPKSKNIVTRQSTRKSAPSTATILLPSENNDIDKSEHAVNGKSLCKVSTKRGGNNRLRGSNNKMNSNSGSSNSKTSNNTNNNNSSVIKDNEGNDADKDERQLGVETEGKLGHSRRGIKRTNSQGVQDNTVKNTNATEDESPKSKPTTPGTDGQPPRKRGRPARIKKDSAAIESSVETKSTDIEKNPIESLTSNKTTASGSECNKKDENETKKRTPASRRHTDELLRMRTPASQKRVQASFVEIFKRVKNPESDNSNGENLSK